MYKNWLQYGNTEIVNNTRASVYVANGLTPVGAVIPECDDCPDIAEATGAVDTEYQTPVLDFAPWYREEDPDSADFAGVMATAITGLAGSTMQMSYEEKVGDGGIAGARRAASRVISVTADLVGRTPAGTALGLEWLSAALHPPCSDTADCGGDTLRMFSSCPETCNGQTDPDAAIGINDIATADFTVENGLSTIVTTSTRTNLLTDPSFELGTVIANDWNAHNAGTNGGITREVVTYSVTKGSKAQRIVSSGMDNAATSYAGVISNNLTFAPGAGYARVDVSTLLMPVGRQAALIIESYNVSNVVIGTAKATRQTTGLLEVAFTAPAGTTYVKMTLRHEGATGGDSAALRTETVWDAAMVVAGSSIGYFDGDTTDTPATTFSWTGTAHASTSTAVGTGNWVNFDHQPVASFTNWLTNPAFEVATTGWAAYNTGSTLSRVTSQFVSGVASLQIATNGALANQGAVYTAVAQSTMVAGSKMGAQVRVKGTAGTSVTVTLASTGSGFVDQSVVYVLTGEWDTINVLDATVGATKNPSLTVRLTGTATTTFWVDNAIVYSGTAVPPYFDGDMADDAAYFYAWAGTANASISYAYENAKRGRIVSPLLPGVCDDVTVEWVVSGTNAWAAIQVLDSTGAVASQSAFTLINGTTTLTLSVDPSPGFPEDWRTALVVEGDVIARGYWKSRPLLTVDQCVTPYRRTMYDVVTVEGPTVVEYKTLGDIDDGSSVWTVEWTWVALEPNAWHDAEPIITGAAGKANTSTAIAAGVFLSSTSTVAVNTSLCTLPAPTFVSIADNTNVSPLVMPPSAPVLADPGVMNLAGTNYTRRYMEIPPEDIPRGLASLTWRFVNDTSPKFGIRVRIYENTEAAFGTMEAECSFVQEFYIDYIKANHTLYIDGPSGEVYVYAGLDVLGQPIFADSARNIRGNYGGPFVPEPIGCGRGYVIAVDIPNNYTTSPSDLSGLGTASQGTLTWSLDMVRRA